jgi:hypothetical protein
MFRALLSLCLLATCIAPAAAEDEPTPNSLLISTISRT